MTETLLRELATFAAGTSLRDVPDAVAEDARRSLADTLACILGGTTAEPVRHLSERLHHPSGHAAIIGTRFRSHPHMAALIGGVAGTWMDADSGGTNHPAGGRVPPVPTAHPPVHLLPALFASAGDAHMDGEELLRIYLVSHEVGARIGIATQLLPGIHPHGVHGTSAAAAASSLARALSPEVIARAMELATALPMVTALRVAMTGATVRNAYAGIGARNGMVAVDATVSGVSAPESAFHGILANGLSDALDERRLLDRLGDHWESTRAYVKLHACARWIHPALDAVMSMMPVGGIDPGALEAIDVRTFGFAAMMDDPHPPTDLAAKFSVPYSVAALVVYGRVELEAFTPSALRRPDLLSLAERTRVVEDAAYTRALPARRPTTVTLRFRNGRSQTATVGGSRGDPETAFTIDELEGKFLRLAGASIGEERAGRALDLLRRLPELSDTRTLIEALSPR